MTFTQNDSGMNQLKLAPGLMDAVISLLPGDDCETNLLSSSGRDFIDGVHELFAKIVWSRLTEPGDSMVNMITGALTARLSLVLFIGDVSGSELAKQLSVNKVMITEAQVRRAAAKWNSRLDRNSSEQDVHDAVQMNSRLLTSESQCWPQQINDLEVHKPQLLWCLGDPQILSTQSIAVVGARAVSQYGRQVTHDLTEAICGIGMSVVSGAAYGVDAVAHQTALRELCPTIAVVAGGLDRLYPAAHDQLFREISGCGVICAESPFGTAPTRWRFLTRNRVIASLSRAVLVTEAGNRSGSLNTAGHAAQLGRNLGAVPGPITSPNSAGCHKLIREYGAELIVDSNDIQHLAGVVDRFCQNSPGLQTNEMSSRILSIHARVIDALPLRGSRKRMDIAKHAGIELQQVDTALAELELLGAVIPERSVTNTEQLWSLARK